MLERLRDKAARHPYWTLALVTVAALLPFIAKPFNIDDPLFLWAARQIQAHPSDPYGFNVQWGWTEFPMARVTENPPLASYCLALAAGIFGWNEIGLHLAFLLPAVAVVLGTYRLARKFCNAPGLAALAALFTPVFLVSANTVMCDVMMLAFWVWAVVLWVEGIEEDNFRRLVDAGLFISLAAVTKYYGVCLIPLLLAHGLIFKRRLGRWALALLIPVAIIGIYQLATSTLYGAGLLGAAAHYANSASQVYGFSKLAGTVMALAFTGGCLATVVFLMPFLWHRTTIFFVTTALCAIALVFLAGAVLQKYPALQSPTFTEIQFVFWAMGGLSIVALAGAEVRRRPNAQSWLLALWIWGTFLFTAVVNWTVNGRSVLPMVPAVAILAMRRLRQQYPVRPKFVLLPIAAGVAISLLVAGADFSFAHSVRQLAEQVSAKYSQPPKALWFQGHWGFQYYMQRDGGTPIDFNTSPLQPGDLIVVPSNNTNLRPPKPAMAELMETMSASGLGRVATMDLETGAGFYSSIWGPLPFGFGLVPPQEARVYRLNRPSVAAPANPQ